MKQLKTMLMTALFGAVAIAPMPVNAVLPMNAVFPRFRKVANRLLSSGAHEQIDKDVRIIVTYWPCWLPLTRTLKEEGTERKLEQTANGWVRLNDGERQNVEITDNPDNPDEPVRLSGQRQVSRKWSELTGFGQFVGTATAIAATYGAYLAWLWMQTPVKGG